MSGPVFMSKAMTEFIGLSVKCSYVCLKSIIKSLTYFKELIATVILIIH